MEQINRIEIRGRVGSVNAQTYPQGKVTHFTVATDYAYKDKSGVAVIDTTWHNVTAWDNKGLGDLDKLDKGAKVYVTGRMRYQKFSNADGVERTVCDILATRVMVLDGEETLSHEM